MSPRPDLRLLIVDDDEALAGVLAAELRRGGMLVETVADAESALERLDGAGWDVALIDLRLPGMSGEELLRRIQEASPTTECVVLTGHGSIDAAVRALKDGAYDFLTKPCNLDELEAVLRKAAQTRALKRRNRALERELDRRDPFREFVGGSEALRETLAIVERVAATDTTVLIRGESGVGKELAARAVHRASRRAGEPFVVVDCTTLQEPLLASELFGHEKGAFSGAVARKLGLFEVADGGTVFLDEIGELSLALQAQVLRVLDRGSFRRVGGVRDIEVDVRLLCATHRDLPAMVAEGSFRADLYFRIDVVTIRIPPLRERPDDIPPLAEHFARTLAANGRRPARFAPDALEALARYSWPGNVRELRNVVERALILAEGDVIRRADLPDTVRGDSAPAVGGIAHDEPTLEELERRYIRALLDKYGGHRANVARALGISERNLYRKLHRLDPSPPASSGRSPDTLSGSS